MKLFNIFKRYYVFVYTCNNEFYNALPMKFISKKKAYHHFKKVYEYQCKLINIIQL